MFKNIGGKIKGLAKFLFWLMVIISIIGGVAILAMSIANMGDEPLTIVYGMLGCVACILIGILLAWLQNFLLYGLGELIDSNSKMLKILEDHYTPQVMPAVMQQPVQVAPVPQPAVAPAPVPEEPKK